MPTNQILFTLGGFTAAITLALAPAGCNGGSSDSTETPTTQASTTGTDDDHGHDHAGGDDDHSEHDHAHGDDDHDHGDGGHAHGDEPHPQGDEVSLGKTTVGDLTVECWQGHGKTAPGKEMHLVVKLPDSDNGATIVRAWIGTDDRLSAMVSTGDYAASHDDYDIHAEAPDPLPAGATWWIEIQRPDGTKHVGSIGLR
jgi:hypothetical protein